MKKTLIQHIWLTFCLLLTAVMLIFTTFHFSVVGTSSKFESNFRYESDLQSGESYNLSAFCTSLEKIEESRDADSIIDWDGQKLETYGVGAKSEYNIFSFLLDVGERFIDNLRFDLSALAVSPIKNLLVYLFCFIITLSAFSVFGKGIVQSIQAVVTSVQKLSSSNRGADFRRIGFEAFFTPLIILLGVFIFSFYNSYCLKNHFEIENVISINYTEGLNFLIIFVGTVAIYFVGELAITLITKNRKNNIEMVNQNED